MAFHESFWVVVGTAAPVIALANLVAIGDGWGLRVSFSRHYVKPQTEVEWKRVRKGKRAAFWVYLIGTGNLMAQAFIVFAALEILAVGKNLIPTGLVAAVESVGIVACLLSAVLTAKWRTQAKRAQLAPQQAQHTNGKPI